VDADGVPDDWVAVPVDWTGVNAVAVPVGSETGCNAGAVTGT
jgi:hypothetical protein